MLTNINFGKYYERDSVVHKLSPVFKIISLLIMIVSIFFIDSYKDIIMLTSYLILMMIYSDINILTYLRNIYSIKIFLVFILIIDLIFIKNSLRSCRQRLRPLLKIFFTLKTSLLILLTFRSYPHFLKYYNILKRKKATKLIVAYFSSSFNCIVS